MNVGQAINEAVTDDMERMAYSLFWLVSKQFCDTNDNFESVDLGMVDHDEVSRLIKQNALKMKTPILLYSMPVQPKLFLLVLAENIADAKGLYLQTYKRLPSRVDDVSHGMDKVFYSKIGGYQSIREIKNSVKDFPCIAVLYDKNEKEMDLVEYEYTQMFGKSLRILEG